MTLWNWNEWQISWLLSVVPAEQTLKHIWNVKFVENNKIEWEKGARQLATTKRLISGMDQPVHHRAGQPDSHRHHCFRFNIDHNWKKKINIFLRFPDGSSNRKTRRRQLLINRKFLSFLKLLLLMFKNYWVGKQTLVGKISFRFYTFLQLISNK